MEQFVLVPASVYNKSVTMQSITKQELPKYKTEPKWFSKKKHWQETVW